MKTALSRLGTVVYALALGAVAVPAAQTNSTPANPNPALLVWIKPGTFTMGSPANERGHRPDEGPLEVTISKGLWMSKYEVTQKEYQTLMGNNPSFFKRNMKRPVEEVTWNDATNYCWMLTVREKDAGRLPDGYVYRLPTEAEWEYACRAGSTNRLSYGDDSGYTQLANYAWYAANSGDTTHTVGGKLPNRWGLYDMIGNVWEWCSDRYGSYPGGSVTDPQGSFAGSFRVIRGGSWSYSGGYCRSAHRGDYWPHDKGMNFGFRPVLASGP